MNQMYYTLNKYFAPDPFCLQLGAVVDVSSRTTFQIKSVLNDRFNRIICLPLGQRWISISSPGGQRV